MFRCRLTGVGGPEVVGVAGEEGLVVLRRQVHVVVSQRLSTGDPSIPAQTKTVLFRTFQTSSPPESTDKYYFLAFLIHGYAPVHESDPTALTFVKLYLAGTGIITTMGGQTDQTRRRSEELKMKDKTER